MRLLLFVALLGSSRQNALLMALGLPVVSVLTSGHPVFPKFVLIQIELVINVVFFYSLYGRSNRFVSSAAVSILASKAFYYAAKAVLIETALLGGDLIGTPWPYQFATIFLILVGGGLVCRAKRGVGN
jgi:hypothetical protein